MPNFKVEINGPKSGGDVFEVKNLMVTSSENATVSASLE